MPLKRSAKITLTVPSAQDTLEIITVFSARLHVSRSHKDRKLMERSREAEKEL